MDDPTGPAEAGSRPEIAVSTTTTRENRTGSWRYLRPAYRDRVAPCNAACPAGVDVEGYMALLGEGRVDEATDLLLRENPMPAVTGRVCHRPCEASCNRARLDEAVSVHAVERALGDRALDRSLPAPGAPERSERVAVVGSGPAGLACAWHLANMGYGVTVLEADDRAGGMLRQGIPGYRLPRDVLDRQLDRIRAAGVEIRCRTGLGGDVDWSDLEGFDAAFVATGAHGERSLGVPGEERPEVLPGLSFLKALNRGRAIPVGRRVAVVGGGNTAVDCARTALRLGAEPVVVYRRTEEQMPAIPQEVAEARREGVKFVFLASPTAFVERDGRLAGVECRRMELGEPDASGRPRPVPAESGGFTLLADTVLTAIGERADGPSLPEQVAWEDGGVATDGWGETGRPLVFVGGDLAGEERTVAHALGSGKRAALGIDRRLRQRDGEEPPDGPSEELRWGGTGAVSAARWTGTDPVRRRNPVNEIAGPEAINPAHFEPVPRHREPELGDGRRSSGFREVNLGLDRETALAEALRCLNCGVCNDCELCRIFCPDVAVSRSDGGELRVDLDYCKGCGVCARECPRGALTMIREER